MDVFGKLAARCRHETSLSVPEPMRQPLSADERDALALWIRGQRSAARPERQSWSVFWNGGVPFFRTEIAHLLRGNEAHNILQCAPSLRSPSQLQCWNALESGLRFVLERLDAFRCQFFDADLLIIIDNRIANGAVCYGPKAGSDGAKGSGLDWRIVEPVDVLEALLSSWGSLHPMNKFARERLCDIADKALTLRP